MVYGAINEKGEEFFTYLPKLFDTIDNAQCHECGMGRCYGRSTADDLCGCRA